ncbi:MAG: magnesium transporter, partial [Candidatus Dormibacteraeota bacterium]|nr:magnesium transporter [Candidatus Dormibacteraeota bacterium]
MKHDTAAFAARPKLLTARPDVQRLAEKLRAGLAANDPAGIRAVIEEQHPADLADAMIFLNDQEDLAVFRHLTPAEAAEVLDEVDPLTEAGLVRATSAPQLAALLDLLPPDEATDVLAALPAAEGEQVLALIDPAQAAAIRTLRGYPPDTAGGIMSLGFVAVPEGATQMEALAAFRAQRDADPIFYIYVVDAQGGFVGSVTLRRLLTAAAETPLRTLLEPDALTVPPECDQEQVGNIFARYDLLALPVVATGAGHRLLGVITADDVIDVLQAEHTEDLERTAGSDAQELEQKSPLQVARLRLPWIMATMFIELLAGVVIHVFDQTLTRIILLASFMPIISAISGNTGLQSAAIIIRGLSTGLIQLSHWRAAVVRQFLTSLLLGGACGLVLGIIGAIWSGNVV